MSKSQKKVTAKTKPAKSTKAKPKTAAATKSTSAKKPKTVAAKKTTTTQAKAKTAPKKPAATKTKKAPAKPKTKVKPVIIEVIEDELVEDKIFPDLPEHLEDSSYLSDEEDILASQDQELDQQEKFFSEIVDEMAKEQGARETTETGSTRRSRVALYRRFVWRFVIGIGALAALIFFLSFSRLTISIFPSGEAVSGHTLIRVASSFTETEASEGDYREQVLGELKIVDLSEEKEFTATGEEFVGEEIYGQVTIINTTDKDQPLVATTRLLSPDDKLYRLKAGVTVPARGEVQAEIYVDEPSDSLAIAPTSFTIPGLWAGLQDKIYARSQEPFIYKQRVTNYVKASDIERAVSEMNSILLAKLKLEQKNTPEDKQEIYEFLTPTKFTYEVKPGEAVKTFTVKASSQVLNISLPKEEISRLTDKLLKLNLPDDKTLINPQAENVVYSFESYDAELAEAVVKLSFSGTMILKRDNDLVDKKALVNLSQAQLTTYLKSFPEIKNFNLEFYPKFIKRAPWLPERIEIDVKDLSKEI